jgi:hypothetical protein
VRYSNRCISGRLDGTHLKTEQIGTAHPSVAQSDLFPVGPHRTTTSRPHLPSPDAIAAMKQFSEALLCSTFAPDGGVKAEGSVPQELLIKCLPMSETDRVLSKLGAPAHNPAHTLLCCLRIYPERGKERGKRLRADSIPPSPPEHLLSGTCKQVIPILIPKSARESSMNREVNLTKRVRTPHGWRYCTVVLSANGRVKPDLVLVNGKQESHKEGAYYLEWREGSKRVRLSVGKYAADASARRQRKEAELNAVNNGVSVVPEGQNGRKSVAVAVAEFLDETKLTKKPKTLAAYSTALSYFVESCHKLNLEDIDRRDLLKFCAFLRDEKEQAPRSVYNKFENVMTFLKAPAHHLF